MTTGEGIRKAMADAIKARGFVASELLAGRTTPIEYLLTESRVRVARRNLERFRLESFVRFNGSQMTLADAEDLESAYETLAQLGYNNPRVVDTLRDVIEAGYRLPFDEDWT